MDDEIGYGNPPKHTQFKPGQSGNPKGRPKKQKQSLEEIVMNELKQVVQINEQGESVIVSKMELLGKALVNHAIKGDVKAFKIIQEITNQSKDLGTLNNVLIYIPDNGRAPELTAERFKEQVALGHTDKNGRLINQPPPTDFSPYDFEE